MLPASIFLDDSDDALGAVSSAAAAKRDAEKYIADKGWNLGFNDQGRYVVVGTSDIAGEPSSPSFQAARQSGYGKALLDAKEQVAMLYSQKVATETMYGSEKSASNPENFATPAAPSKEPAPLSIYQKIKLLIHANLDEALKKKGVDPKQATKEQIKAVESAVLTTEFRRTITRMAAAEVGALITQKIFEDGNSIAVVAYYTPRTKELMDAMLGKGPAPKSKPQETPVAKWINNFTKSELYASQGVQIRVDENGDANLIAFGQTPVTINSTLGAKVAEGAAVTVAMGVMRDFAGEFVEAEIKQQIVERSKQYGDMDKGLAEVEQDMAIKEKIKARADALTIQGVTPPIRTWTTKPAPSPSASPANTATASSAPPTSPTPSSKPSGRTSAGIRNSPAKFAGKISRAVPDRPLASRFLGSWPVLRASSEASPRAAPGNPAAATFAIREPAASVHQWRRTPVLRL